MMVQKRHLYFLEVWNGPQKERIELLNKFWESMDHSRFMYSHSGKFGYYFWHADDLFSVRGSVLNIFGNATDPMEIKVEPAGISTFFRLASSL